MQSSLVDFLYKRKQRSIALMLGTIERNVFPPLNSDQQQQIRKVILDQVNDLYDACLDVINSIDDDTVQLNELYLAKLDELHQSVVMNGRTNG